MELLYGDEHLAVFNKPTGLLVHRTTIDRHETSFAVQMARDLVGQRVFPVHRLDKPTSGVLLFALSPEAARRLAGAFEAAAVRKTYLAVVRGIISDCGEVDHPLANEPDQFKGKEVSDRNVMRPAVTRYRRLATIELPVAVGRYATSRYSLAELLPLSGRRHQLRRHLKHLLHPLIGDTRYGEGRHNRFFRETLHCRRLLLHAVELAFPHPATGALTTVTAPLQDDFARVVERFDWWDAIPKQWSLPGK